ASANSTGGSDAAPYLQRAGRVLTLWLSRRVELFARHLSLDPQGQKDRVRRGSGWRSAGALPHRGPLSGTDGPAESRKRRKTLRRPALSPVAGGLPGPRSGGRTSSVIRLAGPGATLGAGPGTTMGEVGSGTATLEASMGAADGGGEGAPAE